ncbi:plasminogen-like [Cyrtonyx montezumae]|uniref:plasminogen-like n=1 Tax=Cyrtonyx montezumae TaxID=9017 RepID=UPI0032DAE5EB
MGAKHLKVSRCTSGSPNHCVTTYMDNLGLSGYQVRSVVALVLVGVEGDILDGYLRTDGVWVLTRNKQFYSTNNEKECAEKCDAEINFNCRAFLFTKKKLQCLTLAENTKTTVVFHSEDAALYEKKKNRNGLDPTVECMECNGEDYHGNVSRTESGLECQRWDAQEPHMHGYTLKHFPGKDLKMNYCRNPDGELRPWCFTMSPTKRWEYCNIPRCNMAVQVFLPEECYQGEGLNYRGTTSITVSGRKCQAWNSKSPHDHGKTPEKFPNADLRENYCRNPDGDSRPWCFTTDPSVPWEYCNLKRCDDHTEEATPNDPPATVAQNVGLTIPPTTSDCINGNGKDYRGTVAKTGNGRTCQEWSSQSPHSHKYFTPLTHPRAGLDKNYCRNPDGDVNGLWCFTTDPGKIWEYCEIPRCSASEHDCGKFSRRSGRTCEPYSMCDASPGSWPWHVSLRISTNMHHCAGTLIHPQWVLTAAQCLQESIEPSSYRIFLGIQNLNAEEPSLQIRNVHKLLKEPSGADIALLKLNSPITMTDHVKPVCLPEISLMMERNSVCFLTAFGKTKGTGTDNRLKEIEFPILENRMCFRPGFFNGNIGNHEFCGGFTSVSVRYCEAEVGGPLVCQNKDRFVQYGVTTWGLDCTQPSKPTGFVQIPSFLSWIKNVMATH